MMVIVEAVLKLPKKAGTKTDIRAKSKLNSMVVQNRGELQKIGKHFGQVIARPDMMRRGRKRLIYGTPESS